MDLPGIKDFSDWKSRKVLLRVDFNVPMEEKNVEGAYRIERALPTIEFLKKEGAKIILISHLTAGRADSLRPVAEFLKKYFPLRFVSSLDFNEIKKETEKMAEGEIILLDNIRRHKGEKENDKSFAKELASLGEIYVNDAFSASHRAHVSISAITNFLPSYAGFLFENEYKNLKSAFNPLHPFLLILGGVKFESKLGVLDKFLNIADKIFIAGGLANNFFKAKGMDVFDSVVDTGADIARYLNNEKIILPIDTKFGNNKILDAGEETIKMLSALVDEAKFILWNGPLGNFEVKGFEKGTEEIAKAIADSNAQTIIGGGDTVAAVGRFGILDKFSFVSTAGGAMLEFLANGTLPGIEALRKKY